MITCFLYKSARLELAGGSLIPVLQVSFGSTSLPSSCERHPVRCRVGEIPQGLHHRLEVSLRFQIARFAVLGASRGGCAMKNTSSKCLRSFRELLGEVPNSPFRLCSKGGGPNGPVRFGVSVT